VDILGVKDKCTAQINTTVLPHCWEDICAWHFVVVVYQEGL